MKLLYELNLENPPFTIHHEDKLLSVGSCFSDNISKKFAIAKFQIGSQPFGQLYNPISIADAIMDIIRNRKYTKLDLFQYNGKYHSFAHHSSYSAVQEKDILDKINEEITDYHNQLKNCTVLFITLGSAIAFENQETKKIVANCHKLPASHFQQKMLRLEDISDSLTSTINLFRTINPTAKIVFTVSPIRYAAFGLPQNSVSKSKLLLAIDELMNQMPAVFYFPAYEIMMDELRDYRFYERDLIHPNTLAIDYIWEKLSALYFTKETIVLINEIFKIQTALGHRPYDTNSNEYITFIEKTKKKIEQIKNTHPYLNLQDWKS